MTAPEQQPESRAVPWLRPVDSSAPAAGRPLVGELGAPLRIALVDPESAFTQVVIKRAEQLDWRHRIFATPPPIDELQAMKLNAIVLDLEVCGEGEGRWEYLARLAAALPDTGLVVATASSTVAQRVRGLRLGADDWIVKPSHPEEVLARVQAVVRRRRGAEVKRAPDPSAHGELQIRPDRYQVHVGGTSSGLTRREYELTLLLVAAEGRVLEREEIYRRIWGYEMPRGDRSVDVFVRKIRKKIEVLSPGWRYIHTHFGIGYRFEAEPAGDG